MAYSRIRPRRGTAYEWSTINPILEEGEWGVEVPDTGIGTGFSKFKIGSGDKHWNDLEYAFDGTAAASINGGGVNEFHVIQLRAGSTATWTEFNPILNNNELTYDTTKRAFKVGNGEDVWTDLPYTNAGSLVDDLFDLGNEDGVDEIHSVSDRDAIVEQIETLDYPDHIVPQPHPEPDPGEGGEDSPTDPDAPSDGEGGDSDPEATIDDLIDPEVTGDDDSDLEDPSIDLDGGNP